MSRNRATRRGIVPCSCPSECVLSHPSLDPISKPDQLRRDHQKIFSGVHLVSNLLLILRKSDKNISDTFKLLRATTRHRECGQVGRNAEPQSMPLPDSCLAGSLYERKVSHAFTTSDSLSFYLACVFKAGVVCIHSSSALLSLHARTDFAKRRVVARASATVTDSNLCIAPRTRHMRTVRSFQNAASHSVARGTARCPQVVQHSVYCLTSLCVEHQRRHASNVNQEIFSKT